MSKSSWSHIRPKVPYVLSVVRLLFLPAIGIILLQCLSAFQQNFDESIFYAPGWFKAIGIRFLWNYLILLIPYAILFALPFFRATSIILSSVVFIFGIAEHYVILFRNTIIYPWDLTSIPLAVKISGTYDFVISKEVVLAAFLFAVMIALAFVGKEPALRLWLRALILAGIIVSGSLYMSLFVMSKTAQLGSNIRFYYTLVNYNYENGVLMNFGYHFRFIFHEEPDGYSAVAVSTALEAYDTTTISIVPGDVQPDVIMVMSEAFSDLRNLGDFETSEPVLPFWDSLSGDNVIKKTLLSSAFGGNTANSEFEVLTGMSMQFFASGTYPFKQYIRQDVTSIASKLKDSGYETLAVHPFDLTGWNRTNVMPHLGFDSFLGENALSAPLRYRTYISDESSYQFIIDQYEEHKKENPETPFFEYLISIQNHGGYSSLSSLPYTITPELIARYPQTSQYLSLMRISDDALQNLISYFESIDHPTVIIFYGDHLPNLTDGFMEYMKTCSDPDDNQYILTRYETQLLVWANYDLSESDLAGLDDSRISNNYVAAYLSDILGVDRTPLQQFLIEMHEDIPALDENYIVDKSGRVYNANNADLPSNIQTWIDTYEKYQYFELYDSTEYR